MLPEMRPASPPPSIGRCSPLSRSFLLGEAPDGALPCGGSTWTAPALRRLHGSYREAGQRDQLKIRVSTLSGEPRRGPVEGRALFARSRSAGRDLLDAPLIGPVRRGVEGEARRWSRSNLWPGRAGSA